MRRRIWVLTLAVVCECVLGQIEAVHADEEVEKSAPQRSSLSAALSPSLSAALC